MVEKKYHVYSEDGFESAHSSQAAAERAAKRGNARRKMKYKVVQCSAYGLTGGGHGTVLAVFG